MLRIFNTLSGEKELLEKPASEKLRMFVCGPTVYDNPHIGNARTYIFFDVFARYLRSQKYKVFYLQNITDVDDKIIARAKEANKSPTALAREFERAYHQNEKALKIISVDKYARATDFIPEIISQIKTLVVKGHAYKIEGDLPTGQAGGYYFDISTFPSYGKLARRTTLGAEDAVSRIDESVNKKNRGDFVLWKLLKPRTNADSTRTNADKISKKPMPAVVDGELMWNTPLGWGRPGWHIEDTAITEKFFGPQYDVHGGAVDLKFPHHEAEIAEQEAASGKSPLARVWMHTGFLLSNGEKMSKSRGNFMTINDFLKNYSADVLRYIVASHHYRSPINYTSDLAAQAENAVSGLQTFAAKLELAAKKSKTRAPAPELKTDITAMSAAFNAAMDDDLNTPLALGSLFTLIGKYEPRVFTIKKSEAKTMAKTISGLLEILGISFAAPKIPAAILRLAAKREALRAIHSFSDADALRESARELGYIIEDTALGPVVMPNHESRLNTGG